MCGSFREKSPAKFCFAERKCKEAFEAVENKNAIRCIVTVEFFFNVNVFKTEQCDSENIRF